MKAKLHYVFAIAIFLIAFSVIGQNSSWKPLETPTFTEAISKLKLNKSKVDFFELDIVTFHNKLNTSADISKVDKTAETIIFVPSEKGKMEGFKIYEASVFSPSLAAKYPKIKSYIGFSLDNNGSRLRMSVSPQGVQTMITYPDKPRIFMQPIQKQSNQYVVYSKADKDILNNPFICSTIDEFNSSTNKNADIKIDEGGANDQTLRKFRIAISTTGEYTAYHGGTVAGALAGINATLSRVNDVFETDMAVTFELVDATQIIYTNSATDPYSDPSTGTTGAWGTELQNTLSSELGATLSEANAAYDIGHLFGGSGGGGNAGCIGCVCRDDTASTSDLNKGSAYTSPADGIPEGDTFDINYVIHEIGHQMGANHTFAYTTEGTGVNSEPGSGTTIMAYAGITGNDDVQPDSDDYFHYHSIDQILTNLTTQTCWQANSVYNPGNITNNPPVANAGNNYIIPAGTPYVLKGSATDTDGSDNLTYCWEQTDSGLVDYLNFGPTLTSGPMNRSLPPSSSPNRYIPRLSSVLQGNITQTNPGLGSDWETVATVDRFLNWALTVRDRNPSAPSGGQTSFDTMQIQVTDGTLLNPVGPFRVTSQSSSGISWTQNTTETITWDVANTDDSGGVNTQFVNILLSADGGLNFDTVLKAGTANDGSETITVPNIAAPFCRIMVEPVGNIYYAVNSADIAIGYTVTTTCNQQFNSSPSPLNLSILDGQETTNTISVPTNGTISSVKVNVDITHTFISDLTISLTHPNNVTAVTLWEENCFTGSGYQDLNIIFQDGASSVSCSSPTTGTYLPINSLSAFDGLDMVGNWELSVTDNFSGDTGTLDNWYVEFCTTTITLDNPKSIEFQNLKVFPNPSNGSFNLEFSNPSNRNIAINVFDMRGRTIYNRTYQKSNDFKEEIKLNNIQTGMYILKVCDGLRTSTKKLIIE
jgi:subtilisin-like proprotein convertase family protein